VQEQINKLKWEVELLKESDKTTKREQDVINEKLSDISKVLFQVKWTGTGILIAIVASETGVINMVKSVMFV